MEKNNKNGDSGQGPKTPMSESDFKKLVEHDIKSAWHLLNAIVSDPNTITGLNEYLYGRYLNQLHRAELEQQTKIEA